jgi:Tfp pilus assembly protein PilF
MPNSISEESPQPRPQVIAGSPDSASSTDEGVFLQAARHFDSQGSIEEAARHYELAMQAAPGNTRIIVAYARLLDRDEKFEQAERMYWEALRWEPNNAGIHNDLGLCQARAGRLNDSLQSLDQAVRLSPQEARFRNNIAKVLVEVGRHEDGLQHLESVHAEAVAHHTLAFFLQEKQDSDLATRYFARALELDPTLARHDRVQPTPQPLSRSTVAVTQWDSTTRSYAAASWKAPGREPGSAYRPATNMMARTSAQRPVREASGPLSAQHQADDEEHRLAVRPQNPPIGLGQVVLLPDTAGLYAPTTSSQSDSPLRLLPPTDSPSSFGGP